MTLPALGGHASTDGGDQLFVVDAVGRLTRPGPAPRGWARRAALLVVGAAVAALVIALAGWLTRRDPGRYFGEQRPGTLLSAGLLFACAETCRRIHALPGAASFGRFWAAHAVLFAYLALDELLRVHERLDKLIHWLLGLNARNRISDHLDDLILIAYAAFAAALWFRARRLLLRLPWTLLTMAAGFVLFAAMLAVDIAAQTKAVEDGLKLVAGATILSAFLAARREIEGSQSGTIAPPGGAEAVVAENWPG